MRKTLTAIFALCFLTTLLFAYCNKENKPSNTQSEKQNSKNDKDFVMKKEKDQAVPGKMELFEVQKGLFMVKGVNALPAKENKGFMSNSYAISTSEGWFIVDTLATPELSAQFLGLVKKKNDLPVKYAMITHYHQDHWYGSQTYKENNTQIIAHKNLKAFAESSSADQMLKVSKERFGVYDSVKVTVPDIIIDKEDKEIDLGGEKFIIKPFTPAHTNTDLVLHLPKRKIIFVGDLININRVPFAGDRNSFTKGWVERIEEMKAMDVDHILTGHSHPLKKSQLDYSLGYLTYMRDKISKLKEEGKSIDEVKKQMQITPYTQEKTANFFHNANIYKIFNDLDTEDMMMFE